MLTIENFVQVDTLLLSWQSNQALRQRYVVGQLQRMENGFRLSYLAESDDYKQAVNDGFSGFPAFPLKSRVYENDVLATFMKRLPPRSRQDFKKYLVSHHLPSTFDGDDFALISHTGMTLPSDGFNLIPNLAEAKIPFDYVMECAGTRHRMVRPEEALQIPIGALVELGQEDDNRFDPNAVLMTVSGQKIGYVPRPFSKVVRNLLHRNVLCSIARISGTQERPVVYVMLSVK